MDWESSMTSLKSFEHVTEKAVLEKERANACESNQADSAHALLSYADNYNTPRNNKLKSS
jgi:hypothetical protein